MNENKLSWEDKKEMYGKLLKGYNIKDDHVQYLTNIMEGFVKTESIKVECMSEKEKETLHDLSKELLLLHGKVSAMVTKNIVKEDKEEVKKEKSSWIEPVEQDQEVTQINSGVIIEPEEEGVIYDLESIKVGTSDKKTPFVDLTDDKKIELMRPLIKKGKSQMSMAKKFGCSRRVIRRLLTVIEAKEPVA
jgi:hypothetical protein